MDQQKQTVEDNRQSLCRSHSRAFIVFVARAAPERGDKSFGRMIYCPAKIQSNQCQNKSVELSCCRVREASTLKMAHNIITVCSDSPLLCWLTESMAKALIKSTFSRYSDHVDRGFLVKHVLKNSTHKLIIANNGLRINFSSQLLALLLNVSCLVLCNSNGMSLRSRRNVSQCSALRSFDCST